MAAPRPAQRPTVVIAAWNEASSLHKNLDRLMDGSDDPGFDVVIVANGCTDSTASVARSVVGVRVIELAEAGKARALNAGDASCVPGTRLYLDADIGATAADVRRLVSALETPPSVGAAPLVAVPDRVVVTADRPWPVRAYYAVQRRLPAARTGLFGRGLIALSLDGRARFDHFPVAIADDLFLDGLFGPDERIVVDGVRTRVEAPATTLALVRRLARVRRGNRELRAAVEAGDVTAPHIRHSARASWWRDVVRSEPRLWPAGVVYATITVTAELWARRGRAAWTSSRGAGSSES